MSLSPPPTLTTERLVLSPHTAADFDDLVALWTDPEVTRFIGTGPSTRSEVWARLLRYAGLWTILGFGYLAVRDRATGAFLGDVGLGDFLRGVVPSLDGTAEAGWVFGPAAWGRGIATEAVGALLGWYGTRADAKPVTCIIAPGNDASIRVAAKCGFVLAAEGLLRDRPTLVFRRG